MRIRIQDIPALRDKLITEQNGNCSICKIDLRCVVPCLDHDHDTGVIRGVLCGNCNGLEGKVTNLARRGKRSKGKADWVVSVLGYWRVHSESPRVEIHPTHKTPDEKRLRRNKKVRDNRKKS